MYTHLSCTLFTHCVGVLWPPCCRGHDWDLLRWATPLMVSSHTYSVSHSTSESCGGHQPTTSRDLWDGFYLSVSELVQQLLSCGQHLIHRSSKTHRLSSFTCFWMFSFGRISFRYFLEHFHIPHRPNCRQCWEDYSANAIYYRLQVTLFKM